MHPDFPVYGPIINPNYSTGINPEVGLGMHPSFPVFEPIVHPNYSTGINPLVGPIDPPPIWINHEMARAPPGFFEFNFRESRMDHNLESRIDLYNRLKALSSLIILYKFCESRRLLGNSDDNSAVNLRFNPVDSFDDDNSDDDLFGDLSEMYIRP